MNTRRTVILIVAVVIAAIAAFGLLNYVESAAESAVQDTTPVAVWVVRTPVPKGTPIDQALASGLIVQSETTPNFKPATAVEDPLTELAGQVAFTDLEPETQVLRSTFVSPDRLDTGLSERLSERNLVTVTISVDQARGVANLIEPGDFVNVMAGRTWAVPFFEREGDEAVAVSDGAARDFLNQILAQGAEREILTDMYPDDFRMVYQKAEVLAVGSEIIPDLGETPGNNVEEGANALSTASLGLITLAVPPESAQVILNVGTDNLYLSLVSDDYEPRPILPLDPTTQVLPGERLDQLTPYNGVRTVDGLTEFEVDASVDVSSLPGSGTDSTSSGENVEAVASPDDPADEPATAEGQESQ